MDKSVQSAKKEVEKLKLYLNDVLELKHEAIVH